MSRCLHARLTSLSKRQRSSKFYGTFKATFAQNIDVVINWSNVTRDQYKNSFPGQSEAGRIGFANAQIEGETVSRNFDPQLVARTLEPFRD
ncbi:hypothetical protein BKA82DRAFT_1001870 [Pisolithus tinctorius]|uniref:Uncharacterized protein n=1 Tax=Pisolithus tinctorius Marx 270 TaxID=870435 RepID=A0A0C3P6H5_PISTI|nr:hypothetical protein BKA82DRAFT_1001870 [Pisolithus tinctorius]KIO02964.1 hypothetical protein M404DRAFT_1001870 [Pisolithus tinctorius Marx 270]